MIVSPLAVSVGHAADGKAKTGVSVILPDRPAVASVHVVGGGPGTRETDLLAPEATVERVDAIVLSGGSAFGLAAADGATCWLAERGRGFRVGDAAVPIVPAAILFDLLNGGDKAGVASGALYPALARAACAAASRDVAEGTVGAGSGATTAGLKGGFGAALAVACGGHILALAAANALGEATFGERPYFRAAPFEVDGEFGGLGLPSDLPAAPLPLRTKLGEPRGNTTIAVVATDLALSKAEARRLAIAASAGLALAVFPSFTPLDGDTVFVLATGETPMPDDRIAAMIELSGAAQTTLARAVARGVYRAEPAPGDPFPTWRSRWPGGSA